MADDSGTVHELVTFAAFPVHEKTVHHLESTFPAGQH
jgi:hypothetical protein